MKMDDVRLRRAVKHAAEVHGVPVKEVVNEVLGKDDEPEERPGRKRRHTGLWVTLALVVVAFGASVVWLMKFVNGSPSAGQTNLAQVKASAAPTPETPNQLAGLHFAFDYPAAFDQVRQLKTDAAALEQYSLGAKADYRLSIMVRVRPLESGKLDDDAGYRIRRIDPGAYTQTPGEVAGVPVVVMAKTDTSEQTLFSVYKGKMVTVSMTCSGGSKELAAYMAMVKSSLRWRG